MSQPRHGSPEAHEDLRVLMERLMRFLAPMIRTQVPDGMSFGLAFFHSEADVNDSVFWISDASPEVAAHVLRGLCRKLGRIPDADENALN